MHCTSIVSILPTENSSEIFGNQSERHIAVADGENVTDIFIIRSSVDDVRTVSLVAYGVVFPLIIVLGVAGNVINLIVLTRPSLKGVTFVYLSWLAISDLAVLLTGSISMLRLAGVHGRDYTSAFFFAHLEMPLVNAFMASSVFLVVAVTVDRYWSVCLPTRYADIHNERQARFAITVSFLLAFLLYIPIAFQKFPSPTVHQHYHHQRHRHQQLLVTAPPALQRGMLPATVSPRLFQPPPPTAPSATLPQPSAVGVSAFGRPGPNIGQLTPVARFGDSFSRAFTSAASGYRKRHRRQSLSPNKNASVASWSAAVITARSGDSDAADRSVNAGRSSDDDDDEKLVAGDAHGAGGGGSSGTGDAGPIIDAVVLYNACEWSEVVSHPAFKMYLLFKEVVVRVGPVVVVVVLNTCIIVTFRRLQRRRMALLGNSAENRKFAEEQRLVTLLVAIVIMFLICMTPAAILTVIISDDKEHNFGFQIFRAIANNMEMMNFASNFYVYCLCSSEIRQTSYRLFRDVFDHLACVGVKRVRATSRDRLTITTSAAATTAATQTLNGKDDHLVRVTPTAAGV